MKNKIITILFLTAFTIINIGTIDKARAATADSLINLANFSRTQNGLADLQENSKLTAAAFAKANDMISNDYFAHTSPAGKTPWSFIQAAGYDYTYAGENLAIGYTDNQELHDAWMDSPTHRANILNSNFREIGIAVVTGDYEGTEATVVVQMFGTPVKTEPVVITTTPNPAPKVESAQISDQPQANTNQPATKQFTINRDKTNFSPTQIFSGEKVKFSVALTGTVKTISIAIGDQKIDLLEAATIAKDGELTIYTKEVKIDQTGNLAVILTITDEAGLTESVQLTNLQVAQTILSKENKIVGQSIKDFINQYKIAVISLGLMVVLILIGFVVYRAWPKKNLAKFSPF